MSSVPEAVIKHYKDTRSLVSLTREKIDSNTVQGFIVDYNDQWLVLQYIYDFHLDGFLLLRREDLTSLNCRATDAFQHHLLEVDGILRNVDFDFNIPSGGIVPLLNELPSDRIVIIEDETEYEQFLIGYFLGVDDDFVSLRTFSGAGRWDDEPSNIATEDITSVSFATNYTLAYERYFEKERLNGKESKE